MRGNACMSATLDALESGAPKGVTGTNHDARLKSNLYGSGNVKSFAELQLSRDTGRKVMGFFRLRIFQLLLLFFKNLYLYNLFIESYNS